MATKALCRGQGRPLTYDEWAFARVDVVASSEKRELVAPCQARVGCGSVHISGIHPALRGLV